MNFKPSAISVAVVLSLSLIGCNDDNANNNSSSGNTGLFEQYKNIYRNAGK